MKLLLPHEHGAWVQLGFSLLGALLLGRPSLASGALVVAAILAFWANEPLAILFGHRGERLKTRDGAHAKWMLPLMAGAAGALVALAVALQPAHEAMVGMAPPMVSGVFMLLLVAARRARTTLGEAAAAVTLSSWAVPIAMAGGAAAVTALQMWFALALCFVIATLAVRAVILAAKPKAPRRPRAIALTVALVAVPVVFAVAWFTELPEVVALAVIPAALLALWLGIAPPHPKHLKRVGWGLTAATLVSTMSLVAGLR